MRPSAAFWGFSLDDLLSVEDRRKELHLKATQGSFSALAAAALAGAPGLGFGAPSDGFEPPKPQVLPMVLLRDAWAWL